MSFGNGEWSSENFPVLLNASYALPVQDYRTIRAMLNTDIHLVQVIGNYVTAGPSKLAGFFYRDDNDKTTNDNNGTILVDASGRRWKRIFNMQMHAAWFGVLYDGVTIEDVAMQNAINAAQIAKAELMLDSGTIKLGTTLNVTAHLKMRGVDEFVTIFLVPNVNQTGISIATTDVIRFSDFQIQGSPVALSGDLIALDSGGVSAINQYSKFTNLRFQSGWRQLSVYDGSTWTALDCDFFSPLSTSMSIEDRAHTDAGDMQVLGCVFSGAGVGTAVSQLSAGGLRMSNCKIIAYANCYSLILAAGVATSDLFIGNCSMESFSNAGITLAIAAGVVFGAVEITTNEISGGPIALNMLGNSGPWCNHMEIVANNFGVLNGGTCVVLRGGSDVIFQGNTLVQSTPGTGTGLSLDTSGDWLNVKNNNIKGFLVPVLDACTGANVVIEGNIGYNPVGASALAPGASPWTFTNGHTSADLYLSATSITAVTIDGNALLPAAVANLPGMYVPANSVVVITYTGVLTGKKFVR